MLTELSKRFCELTGIEWNEQIAFGDDCPCFSQSRGEQC